jgi:hypothetical protein
MKYGAGCVQIPVDDLLDIGTEKSILPFKSFLINLAKGFKMILHAPLIIGRLQIPWSVNGGGSGHDFSPLRKSNHHIIEPISCVGISINKLKSTHILFLPSI